MQLSVDGITFDVLCRPLSETTNRPLKSFFIKEKKISLTVMLITYRRLYHTVLYFHKMFYTV